MGQSDIMGSLVQQQCLLYSSYIVNYLVLIAYLLVSYLPHADEHEGPVDKVASLEPEPPEVSGVNLPRLAALQGMDVELVDGSDLHPFRPGLPEELLVADGPSQQRRGQKSGKFCQTLVLKDFHSVSFLF